MRTFANLQEKYDFLTAGKRPGRGTIWVTNEDMNRDFDHQGNPVLLEIPEAHFAAYQQQGYSRFHPGKAAPAPVEAKAVAGAKPGRKAKVQEVEPDTVTENIPDNVDTNE